MKCFHIGNIFFYLINANLKRFKQILYHIREIKQIKYENKVWFFLQFLALEGIIDYVLYVIKVFMKGVFVKLKMWISKYKKRLIYWAFALFIGQICFLNFWWLWGANNVFAEEPETPIQNLTFQKKATSRLQDLSFYRRAFYVLLYPILALAGMLVNNSLVYAEVFNFDVVLWQLWNIVRNLSNYALWFLFLFYIFKFLIGGQKSDDMKKLLKSTLIAWVWIQASWFLLAVLIDISNILTYSVWWLPIRVLWDQTDFWNPYIFRTVIYTNTDTPDSVHFYLSEPWDGENSYISECQTFPYSYNQGSDRLYEELILAPKMIYYYDTSSNSYKSTQELACHIWDDVYYFSSLFVSRESWWGDWIDKQQAYEASLHDAIDELQSYEVGEMQGLVSNARILEIGDAHSGTSELGVGAYATGRHFWLDVNNERKGEWLWLKRLKDVLTGSYVGVFTALYSSLLNAWEDLRVSKVSDPWIYTSLLNVVLSLCHTLAVGIPLIAMLVVFVMRIWVIWMAIVLSPAIILLKAFDLEWKIWKDVDILKYLSVKNLIGIIFSPAIICFAVSISTVLVRLISTVNVQDVITDDIDILGWLIRVSIGWLWLNIGRLLCSVIWVAVSWFLVRSAIKASELWKSKIVTWLESLAKTAIWSVPIIPIPSKGGWVDYVWVNTVFWWNWQEGIFSKISTKLKTKYNDESNRAVNALFDSEGTEKEAISNRRTAYINWLTSLTASEIKENWITTQEILIWENNDTPAKFWDFWESDKKQIVQSINGIKDVNVRKAFGEKAGIIPISEEVSYKFNNSTNKYEEQNGSKEISSST